MGRISKIEKPIHFFGGEGELLFDCCVAAGDAAGVLTAGVGVGVGVGVAAGACSGIPDCSTEVVPLMNGNERHKAINMKPAAAPIVIFASSV